MRKGDSDVTVPKLTYDDRLNALNKAKNVRAQRAELREKINTSDLSLQDVFNLGDSGNETVLRTPIRSILTAFPRIGGVRADEIMASCDVSPTRRVRGIGSRQRERLLRAMRAYSV